MKKYIALLFIVFSLLALSSCSLENKKQTFDELQSSITEFRKEFNTKNEFYKEISYYVKKDTDIVQDKCTILCDKNYNTIEVINGYDNDSNNGYIKKENDSYNYYSYKLIKNTNFYSKSETNIESVYLANIDDEIFNIDYKLNNIKISKNNKTYEITSSVDNLCCEDVKKLIKDLFPEAYNLYKVKRSITITDEYINSSYQLSLQGQTNIGKNQFTITYIYQFSDISPKNFEDYLLLGTDKTNPDTISNQETIDTYGNCLYYKNTFPEGFYKVSSYGTVYSHLYNTNDIAISKNKYGNIIKLDNTISYISLQSDYTISITPLTRTTISDVGSYQTGTDFIIAMKDNKKYVLKNNGSSAINMSSQNIKSTAVLNSQEETIIYTENIEDISTYLYCNSKEANSIELKEYNEDDFVSKGYYLTSPFFTMNYKLHADNGLYLMNFTNTTIRYVYDVKNKKNISYDKFESYDRYYRLDGDYIITLDIENKKFTNQLTIKKVNEEDINKNISLEIFNGKEYTDFEAYITGVKTTDTQSIRYNFTLTSENNRILLTKYYYTNTTSFDSNIEIYDNSNNLIFDTKNIYSYSIYKLILNPGDYYIKITNIAIYGINVYLDNDCTSDYSYDYTNIPSYKNDITDCSNNICYLEVSEDTTYTITNIDMAAYRFLCIIDTTNENKYDYFYDSVTLKKGKYIIIVLKKNFDSFSMNIEKNE